MCDYSGSEGRVGDDNCIVRVGCIAIVLSVSLLSVSVGTTVTTAAV